MRTKSCDGILLFLISGVIPNVSNPEEFQRKYGVIVFEVNNKLRCGVVACLWPLRKILIKRGGSKEHRTEICTLRDIPICDVLIKRGGFKEHTRESSTTRHIPL